MLILGIESSCDDTSVALLDCSDQGCFVIKEKTASQIDIHKKYGGVVPELAGRAHAEKIVPLVEEVLSPLTKQKGDVSSVIDTPRLYEATPLDRGEVKPDVIAVTAGPGLITGLLVGVETAQTLSYVWDIPLVAVNHLEGHIHSVEISKPQDTSNKQSPNRNVKNKNVILNSFQYLFDKKQSSAKKILKQVQNDKTNTSNISNNSHISNITYPALALIASGGHTELIYIPQQGQYQKIGATKDDAVGECFDKVAKLLNLSYPGGPQISKLAETGNPEAIKFPRPMLNDKTYNFSFSGLKTSALYWLRDNQLKSPLKKPILNLVQEEVDSVEAGVCKSSDHPNIKTVNDQQHSPTFLNEKNTDKSINDFCASFQQAIVDVLVTKTIRASQKYQPKTIILGGGVSANKQLRKMLKREIQQNFPHSSFLIPHSSYSMDNATMIAIAGYYKVKNNQFTKWDKIKADPNWEL